MAQAQQWRETPPRFEAKVIWPTEMTARLIVRVTKGKRGGLWHDRELYIAMNGLRRELQSGSPIKARQGRFWIDIPRNLFREGENLFEISDVETGYTHEYAYDYNPPKRLSPDERKIEALKTKKRLHEVEREAHVAEKELEEKKNPPAPDPHTSALAELKRRTIVAAAEKEALEAEEALEIAKTKRSLVVVIGRCQLCSAELPQGVHHCPRCMRMSTPVKRLCPKCRAEVDPKANDCKACGEHFPLTVDRALGLNYVVCGNCNHGEELDDWMAARNFPFLFQTEPGAKVGCFETPQRASMVWKNFFEPKGSERPLDQVESALRVDDTRPWQFTSAQRATGFLNTSVCARCGAKSFKLSPVIGAARKIGAPAAQATLVATAKTGSFLWRAFKGAAEELRSLRGGKK